MTRMDVGGLCVCGATDCPSCGPAQGYEVARKWVHGRGYVYYNPEEGEEAEEDLGDEREADQTQENENVD